MNLIERVKLIERLDEVIDNVTNANDPGEIDVDKLLDVLHEARGAVIGDSA